MESSWTLKRLMIQYHFQHFNKIILSQYMFVGKV